MKISHSSGAVSKLLLFLAIAILVVIIIIFIILKITGGRSATSQAPQTPTTTEPTPPPPLVYNTTLGDVKFILQDARDLGSVLVAKNSYEQNVKTTEKFIQVTVGAQNNGKTDLPQHSWDLGNLVDSEGRNFIPAQRAYSFLPKPDQCGAILKPAFKPVPCVKIYEVSRLSQNLKIEVKTLDPKKMNSYLDLE